MTDNIYIIGGKKKKRTRGIWQATRLEGKVKNKGIKKIKKPKQK